MHFDKIKTNNINSLILDKNSLSKSNDLAQIKHYPPTNKEWFNSVYQYNQNYLKSLPITDIVINKLFKSYFYLTSSFEQYKVKAKNKRIRNKRLSANRIYLSTPEIKHSNNKVIITLYTYNRTSFCNGLTISKKKIWIKKNTFFMKKFFSFGTLNLSKKFIISRIFSNIINPFDRLVKNKIKINKKQNYDLSALESLKKRKTNKKKNSTLNTLKEINKNEKKIYVFNRLKKSKVILNKTELYILTLFRNILSIKNFSNNLSKLYNNSTIFNILKKLNSRKNYHLFSTFNKTNNTVYSNLIKYYRTNYKYNFFKTKMYILKYRNKLRKQIFFKNRIKLGDFNIFVTNGKFNTKYNNKYFKDIQYKLNVIKNKYLRNEKYSLAKEVYFKNNQIKPQFYGLVRNLLLKNNKQFKPKFNTLKKNKYSDLFFKSLIDFKNTYFTNFKNKYLNRLYFKSIGFRKNYLKKKKFYGKKNFTYTVNKFFRRFKINLYYKKKFSFINFANYISYFKDQFSNNELNFRFKIIFNKFNNFIICKIHQLDLKKFNYTFKLIKFKLEEYKVIKFNLKKYNFIFELVNIKNPFILSYYFKKLFKRRRFTTYKKNIQSLWKIILLKTDYKKVIRKIKLIDNSNLKTIVQNISLKIDSSKLHKFTLFSLFIQPTLSINRTKNSNNFSTLSLNEKKNILLHQSNNMLKKRLNSVFPLYLYNLQMANIHYYKYKDWFLISLNNIMQNIYNKKIEFNFINLKYIHLSSDMLSESMAIKLKNRKNRILKVLFRVLRLIKIPSLHSFLSTIDLRNKNKNFNLSNYKTLTHFDSMNRQRKLMDCINMKKISGVRFEAAGRLTKRLTASRSLFKIKHKGTLKNIQSSYKGIPSVMLRGYMKSSIQYSNINSKTLNGSFGLKTWISCS